MTLIALNEALDEIRQAESFLLTTHTHPDGDAIGSMLALHHFLLDLGKTDITSACHDPVPRVYSFLPMAGGVVGADALRETYDLVIIIDVAQRARVGSIGDAFADNQRVLVLDHHLEESPCGDVNYMDATMASASEIVVDLYYEAGLSMSHDAAACAYVGLATDTGGFRFGNTNARAHAHAEQLVSTGIDVSEISSRVFDDVSRKKIALMRVLLDNLSVSECRRYSYSTITLADMESNQATAEDLDGLVNLTRDIEGVAVGALFREMEGEQTKVSLRSKSGFNSSACLNSFGGGGHAGAAGATVDMPLEECRESVLAAVRSQLSETN